MVASLIISVIISIVLAGYANYLQRRINGQVNTLRLYEVSVIALYMLLKNARLNSNGVWFVTREDLLKYEYGWVLEHFLDGRQNWRGYISHCYGDQSKEFASKHGAPNVTRERANPSSRVD